MHQSCAHTRALSRAKTALDRQWRAFIALMMLLTLAATPLIAQETTPGTAPESKPAATPAAQESADAEESAPAPAPAHDLFSKLPAHTSAPDGPDVLVLTNGTRLNGEFHQFRGGNVEFKDKHLGLVKIARHYIESLFIASGETVYLQRAADEEPLEARLLPGLYTEETGFDLFRIKQEALEPPVGEPVPATAARTDLADVHEFRKASWTLTPAEWKFSGTLSFSFQTYEGNTDRLQYGNDFRLQLRHPSHEFMLRQTSTYAEDDNKRSIQRALGELQYNYRFTDAHAIFLRETLEHDDFRKLKVRSVIAGGGTFYLYKRKEFSWTVDIGLSYTYEDYERGAKDNEFGGGNINARVEWKPEEDIAFIFNDRYNQSFKRGDTFDNAFEGTFRVNVWGALTTEFGFWWGYRSQPPGKLLKDDYRTTVRFGWSF